MQQTMAPQPSPDSGPPIVEPKHGKVKLTAKGKRNGKAIQWSLDVNDNGPPDGKVTRIEVPKGSGPCEVTIKIKMDDPDVTFDPAKPLSASEAGCPPPHSGIETDQIDPHSVSVCKGGKELTFTDRNSRSAEIHYALNFVDAEPFDPMIRNRW